MTAVASFLAFTATVAGISWWMTRKDWMNTPEAYFLAGRSLTAWVIAGSLMLTNLSLTKKAGFSVASGAKTGAVTLIQRFGSALNLKKQP